MNPNIFEAAYFSHESAIFPIYNCLSVHNLRKRNVKSSTRPGPGDE